jgi:hypothetical protein
VFSFQFSVFSFQEESAEGVVEEVEIVDGRTGNDGNYITYNL